MASGQFAPGARPAGVSGRQETAERSRVESGHAAGCGYRLCRPETPAEWAAYHDIRRDVLLESREYAFDHPDGDEELAPRHYPLLFWRGDRPIGTIRIDGLDGGFAALRLVAIDPACQGQGHGLHLLCEAERFSRDLGCRLAVVYATPEAAGFYARAGYAEESWDDCCVGGIVQMIKPLA